VSAVNRLLARRGPLLAGLLAALASVPALTLPFLADDWIDLAVAAGLRAKVPFGYFRPLCFLTYDIEWRLWALTPALSHVTNLILIAASAALVVVLIRRYTGDGALAGAAGLIFAIYPYHVENAAWIAARADPLFAVFFLAAAYFYDRWRVAPRGVPIAALLLFEAALLSKEAAVTLPVFLLLVAAFDRSRWPGRAEWFRGPVPMIVLAIVHFLWLRPRAIGSAGLGVFDTVGPYWIKKLLAFAVAALIPLQTEFLEGRPFVFGAIALAVGAALVVGARAGSRALPRLVLAAAAAFVVLLGPSIVSFQARYLFLPSAASALALAALIRAAPRRFRIAAVVVLGVGWMGASAEQWVGWRAAGSVSRILVKDLVEASRRPEVQELVVANMPHRVHGAPISHDFAATVQLSGGRPVAVLAATLVDYVNPRADALDGAIDAAITLPSLAAEVQLRIPARRYSRCVRPVPRDGTTLNVAAGVTVSFEGGGVVQVRIEPDQAHSRSALVWERGRLETLF